MTRGVLRSSSALVMLTYVLCHLGNHILLLISIPFADAAHHVLLDPWRTNAGTALLLTAILVHYGNALWSIYRRRVLVLPAWGWWQLGLGLSIPLILLLHIAATRASELAYGVGTNYSSVLLRLWVLAPWRGVLQVVLLALVWVHASIGVHYWLRNKPWYGRWRSALYVVALLWPALALAGFVTAGNQLAASAQAPAWLANEKAVNHIDAATGAWADRLALWLIAAHIGLVALAFGARAVRRALERGRRPPLLTHANGRTIRVPPGATVLEALHENRIPHPSVCGGRARCTTCRVHVVKGLERLAPPSPLETRALARFGAGADCRLACQIRPAADLSIVPLLPAAASAADGLKRSEFAGSERVVTVMFVDLRGSTALSESRLPYDVLFLLDAFFLEMRAALAAAGGHFSQFTGDGLMALFGLDAPGDGGEVRAALDCAWDMHARLHELNARLVPDLPEPLRIGIGIHRGEAIVGRLGPPGSQILTAIGDTVNTTARLEGLSKRHDGAVIVSRSAANAAGLRFGDDALHDAMLTGRSEPIAYYALELAATGSRGG